jgi:hypothetical protein
MKKQTIAAACAVLLSASVGLVHAQTQPTAMEPAKKQKQFSVFALADQMGSTIAEVSPEGATWGAGVQWRKKSEKGMLASGIDLAYQPLGTLESAVNIDNGGTSTDGTLRARNQYLTAHYVLRLSPFNGWFQPFAEGFAGGRAAVLNTEFTTEDQTLQDKLSGAGVQEFGATWNYGWGFGCRLRMAEGFYVMARYASISSGELDQVTEVSITGDGNVATVVEPVAMPTSSVLAGISWDMGLKKARRRAAGN